MDLAARRGFRVDLVATRGFRVDLVATRGFDPLSQTPHSEIQNLSIQRQVWILHTARWRAWSQRQPNMTGSR